MKALIQEFWQEEDGLQTVEMVLILIVMVGLVVTLRIAAEEWLTNITDKVSAYINEIEIRPAQPNIKPGP